MTALNPRPQITKTSKKKHACRKLLRAASLGNNCSDAKGKVVNRVFDAVSGTPGVQLALPNPRGTIPGGLRCKFDFPGVRETPTAKVDSVR